MNICRVRIVILCVLLAGCLVTTFCILHYQRHHLQNYPFSELSIDDVLSIGVCADLGFPAVTNELDLSAHADFLALLQEIHTAARATPIRQPIAGGTEHMFVLSLKNGETIYFAARSPFLVYNGQYFHADTRSLDLLSEYYMNYALKYLTP